MAQKRDGRCDLRAGCNPHGILRIRRLSPPAVMVGLLIVTALGMGVGLARPWLGKHSFASAQVSLIARNHVEYGFGETHFVSNLRIDRNDPDERIVYSHRPVLFPVVLAAVFHVFGPSEWAARLLVIAIALAATWFMYRLVSAVADPWSGCLAAALFALAPANLHCGRVVSLTQGVVLFLVLVPYLYWRWLETGRRRDYAWLLLVAAAGMMVNWQAYYLAVVLPLHWLLFVRRSADVGKMLGLVALAPLMFSLFLVHLTVFAGDQFGELWDVFRYRAGMMTAEQQIEFYHHAAIFTPLELLTQLGRHAVDYLLPPLLVVATATGAVLAVRIAQRRVDGRRWSMPLVLLMAPVIHTAVFSNTMFVHDYLIVLFLPGTAALGGIGLTWLVRTTYLRRQAVALAVGLVALFLVQAVAVRIEMHHHVDATPFVIGSELAAATEPLDEVVVLGAGYHPAVQWYADRNLYFLDRDGPLREIVPDRRRIVAVVKWTDAWIEELSRADDQAAVLMAERTRRALQRVVVEESPIDETENLWLYEVQPGQAAAAERTGGA